MGDIFTGVLVHKIWSDLWGNVGRTIQAVLTIAIGAFAVGAILGGSQLMNQDTTRNWQSANPAAVQLRTDPQVTEGMIEALEDEQVPVTEGQMEQSIQWRLAPDDPWQPGTLVAREDFSEMQLFTLDLDAGQWPERDLMGVLRGYGLGPGDFVYMEVEERERIIQLNSIVSDVNAFPAALGGDPTFYTTRRRFAEITETDGFRLVMGGIPNYTEERALRTADDIEDDLEGQIIGGEAIEVTPGTLFGEKVVDPHEYLFSDTLNGVNTILIIMAFACVVLGLFLIYNTVTAIISQQVPQIGALKAIGASKAQIFIIYYAIVFVYGFLAMLLSVPLGALGAHGLRSAIMELFGLDAGPFAFSPMALAIQIPMCLFAPMLIATIPISEGANITVREAIGSYGLGGGGNLVDRLLAFVTFIPRMTAMAISNTFRNMRRVVMTQITLVGAGVMFMAVLTTQANVSYTFGNLVLNTFTSQAEYQLNTPERFEKIEGIALGFAGVDRVEIWSQTNQQMRRAGEPEAFDDPNVTISGLPIPSATYNPNLRKGRWLTEADEYAIVLHEKLAQKIDVDVGDQVVLHLSGQDRDTPPWQVVGLMFEPGFVSENAAKVPRETLLNETREYGTGTLVNVQSAQHAERNSAVAFANQLAIYLEDRGIDVITTDFTIFEQSEALIGSVSIVIALLVMMAIIIAAVGGISLSGVLSINVLERQREIGVLRAIGASSGAIGTLFITEGLLLGWISWLIALLISRVASRFMTEAVGGALDTTIIYQYSLSGIWFWLLIITLMSAAASWLPAQGAINVSVRESLSYD